MFAVTGVAVGVGVEVEVGSGVKVTVTSEVTVACGASPEGDKHAERIEARMKRKTIDFFM
jgi:hypothetical protein